MLDFAAILVSETIRQLQERLQRKYGLQALWLSSQPGGVVVNKIVAGTRGRGTGTAAMREILAYARQRGLVVALTPDSRWGTSVAKLARWYKRLGFVANKGRNKDFRFQETLLRR